MQAMVFIDGRNLYHSLKGRFGRTDLDFGRFVNRITEGYVLVRTYYYNAPLDQTKDPERYARQRRFFQSLEQLDNFEVKLGRLVYRDEGPPYEKGVDVRLAVDLVHHASRQSFDIAYLVSGDTDFVDALQTVKDYGRNVVVVLCDPRGSNALRQTADRTLVLDEAFLKDCWRTNPHLAPSSQEPV